MYFVALAVKASIDPALPPVCEYVPLVALTIAFTSAGVRDEAQAEPWWWPNRRGATRG